MQIEGTVHISDYAEWGKFSDGILLSIFEYIESICLFTENTRNVSVRLQRITEWICMYIYGNTWMHKESNISANSYQNQKYFSMLIESQMGSFGQTTSNEKISFKCVPWNRHGLRDSAPSWHISCPISSSICSSCCHLRLSLLILLFSYTHIWRPHPPVISVCPFSTSCLLSCPSHSAVISACPLSSSCHDSCSVSSCWHLSLSVLIPVALQLSISSSCHYCLSRLILRSFQ